jgi:predicted DNA-binding antitoxin AbrB/MazE fold protein
MNTIQAIFEGGVFRPTEPVDLPEHSTVEFEPRVIDPNVAKQLEEMAKTDPELAAVYEVLSRRHNSGHHDTAERHNEHQP